MIPVMDSRRRLLGAKALQRRRRYWEHARRRILDRCPGMDGAEIQEFRRLVHQGEFQWIRRLTGTRSLCRCVLASGKALWFVYSRSLEEVVTVYPGEPEYLEAERQQERGQGQEESN